MKKITSYLDNLTYDPKLDKTFIAKSLANPRLVILIIMMIILIGYTSLTTIPKVLNPQIKIPIVSVVTAIPGAGPKDVESLITQPIEDGVNGVSDVKTVTSSSQNSVSIVTIEFNSGVDPDKARQDVQSAVDTVTLPTDAQTPKVKKFDFQNTPVWSFTLTGADTANLENFSQILKQRLKNVSSIKDVTISGISQQEVEIVLKPSAIATYKINPLALTQQITAGLGSYPAGTVQTTNLSFALSIDPAITKLDDIRNTRVSLGTSSVLLSDIATIQERSKPDEPGSLYATQTQRAQPAVSFDVYKTASSNITKAADDAKKEVDSAMTQYPNSFHIATVYNTGERVTKQFSDLVRDFTITVSLVFITLFIFVGIRQALVALLSTPLTFFVTFTIMKYTGIDLSFIAIFSLLLSLGLLVDDTVVVISAMTSYFRTGKFTPHQAGLLVWRDFLVAIFTTTITTVWAFLPLLLASGIIGDFIKAIPIVVSATLIASFIVAMFVILPVLILILEGNVPSRVKTLLKIIVIVILLGILLSVLPKGPLFPFELIAAALFLFVTSRIRRKAVDEAARALDTRKESNPILKNIPRYMDDGIIHFGRISGRYEGIMHRVLTSQTLRRRTVAMVIIFSIFSYLLLPFGLVKNEFFPKSDNDYLFISLELPAGTNTAVTITESKRLLEELRKTDGIAYVKADIGRANSDTGGTTSAGNNTTLFSLELPPKGQRSRNSLDIANSLRAKYASYQKGTLQVQEESGGPPAGADVQIKLFGDDLTQLDTYANRVEDYLKKRPGVTNVDKSIKPGTSKLVFVPNREKMSENGISTDILGYWLRLFASGFKANSIKLENSISTDKEDITIRMSTGPEMADAVNSIVIPTPSGKSVPLASLGNLSLVPNPTLITREGGKRTISVTAAIAKGYSITDANKNLQTFADNGLHLSQGYSWKTGGANEENANSVNSILQAMLLSFLLIIITMVVQFSSFRRALIVMLVIPLSISGVFILFALTGTPLSFPALIGVLALFGIVVKNSILIVDKIVQNQRIGMPYVDAIIDGAGSRLEAITLTTIATIVGLIPITLSDPLWRGLGGAIIAGLAFSGTIMLFFIPVVYYFWFRPASER